jgi:malate/lactate dehydrogenase
MIGGIDIIDISLAEVSVLKAEPNRGCQVVENIPICPPGSIENSDFVRSFGFERVLSSGTFLDSLRFRFHLAQRLSVDPASVEAQIVGEHGTSDAPSSVKSGTRTYPRYGVTLSLPSVLGREGVVQILEPEMSEQERQALQRSADTLKSAFARVKEKA